MKKNKLYKTIFCILVLLTLFIPSLFAAEISGIQHYGNDFIYENNGYVLISNSFDGITFGNGGNNAIHNTAKSDLTIMLARRFGIFFDNQNNSKFTNDGNAYISSKDTISSFSDGENNVIHNTATGNLVLKTMHDYQSGSGIRFFTEKDSKFINEGNTTIEINREGFGFYSGENNAIHNAATGNLNIINTLSLYSIFFKKEKNSNFTNEGNTTISGADTYIEFQDGENNAIHNTATGNLNIMGVYGGIFFNNQNNSNFTNEGNTTINSDYFGIEFQDGENNAIHNTATGKLNITGKYGIYFYQTTDSNFTNEGVTTINTQNNGIFFYEGENNAIHNAATGNLNITTKYRSGIYSSGSGIEHIINDGSMSIITALNDSINLADGNDTFTNTGTLSLNGDINGGDGEDKFIWGGDLIETFDQDIKNFETIDKNGEGTWNLTGQILGATQLNINKGKFNFKDSLTINGDLNLYGSLVIDVNDAAADFIDITGTANIKEGKLIIQTPANLTLPEGWEKTILHAGTIDGEFAEYSDDSSDYDFLLDYNATRILLTFYADTNGTGGDDTNGTSGGDDTNGTSGGDDTNGTSGGDDTNTTVTYLDNNSVNINTVASLSLTGVINNILLNATHNIKASASNFYIPFNNDKSKFWISIINKEYDYRNMEENIETIGFDTNIFDNLLIGVAYSNGDITADNIDMDKSIYSLYGKLRYGGFNFYDILSLDKNKDLVSVNNISNYIGADYTINFNRFKLIPKIGLTTIYNSDSHVVIADTGLKFKANITDNLEFTNEVKFSDVIKSKEIDKTVFDNVITNETGLNLKYKKITAGLIYGFSNGAQTSSDWVGLNFNYHF